MNTLHRSIAGAFLFAAASGPAFATLISVSGPASDAGGLAAIIAPPAAALNSAVFADAQRGFDEQQKVILSRDIDTDQGIVAAGTKVSSHLILLNKDPGIGGSLTHTDVVWTFDAPILAVMSDSGGLFEAASTDLLGSTTTLYPTPAGPDVGALGGTAGPFAGFAARGMEGGDSYVIAGNTLTVTMSVSEPGDWIRVLTVAEPTTLAVFAAALLLAGARRRGIR